MADGGIDYVRMAEFAWARLEPERGAFDFEWVDDAVDPFDAAIADVEPRRTAVEG